MHPPFLKSWTILFGLQALLAFLIFRQVLPGGDAYFAYIDIGSDTYGMMTPFAMNLARTFSREGWVDWSFGIGLGAPTAWMTGDTFLLITQLGGPDNVLALRIWVHLLKIALAGAVFLLLARQWVVRHESAIIAALAYSFCGHLIINGQWDSEANVLIFFPLVLWAICRHLRSGGLFAIPLTVAATLLSGIFFVTAGVSLAVAGAAFVALSDSPRAMIRAWLTRVLPLAAAGFLLAAPYLVPVALQFLDSPRVSGAGSLISKLWAQAFTVTDVPLLLVQLGGLFHKDLFGSGNAYSGYMNYFEGPGFFIGLLPLLAVTQLWRGQAADRRALLVGCAGIALYFVFPVFRLASVGFAAPYFRSSCIWVTLALMLMALRGIDRVLVQGVNIRYLVTGAGILAAVLALVVGITPATTAHVATPHVYKLLVLAAVAATVLGLAWRGLIAARLLPMILLGVVVVEIVVVAWPSYFAGRWMVQREAHPYDDETVPALQAIRKADPSVFRVEKTFVSASLADSLAQDYMGVKSYYYQSAGIVAFHDSMDMMAMPPGRRSLNYTNYLMDPGRRFMIHSLLGVKYLISKQALILPGFELAHSGPGWMVYRNELALPLGFVQTRQVTRAAMKELGGLKPDAASTFRDVALMNAVVLDEPLPAWGTAYDLQGLVRGNTVDLQAMYAQPAQALQRTGLQLTHFSDERVEGRIQPDKAGILVFSIPFNQGWSLQIDGAPAPLIHADFGLLGSPVTAGAHAISLTYHAPGRRAGLLLCLLGLFLIGFCQLRAARAARLPAP